MKYDLYTTPALVLNYRERGEASRVYSFFTRNLGKLYATAQGARKLNSKLRFVLQGYSAPVISLVRGGGWRLVNAQEGVSFAGIFADAGRARAFIRVKTLLLRCAPAGEPEPALFDDVLTFATALSQTPPSRLLCFYAEIIGALIVLTHLGYIGDKTAVQAASVLREKNQPHEGGAVFAAIAGKERQLVGIINEALRASQL